VNNKHRKGSLARQEARLPGHDVSWTRHTTAHSGHPAAAHQNQSQPPQFHRGPPFEPSRASSGHRHPRLTGRFSATPHRRDIYRADQSLTNRKVSRTARPAADPSYSTTIRSSLDCKPNLDVNKYCYICVILRLSLRTMLQHPAAIWIRVLSQ